MIAEGDGQSLGGEVCVSRALLLGVVVPHGDDHGRVGGMRLRAVEQVTAQIDHFHGVLLSGFRLLVRLAGPSVMPELRRATPSGVRPSSPSVRHNMTPTMINP